MKFYHSYLAIAVFIAILCSFDNSEATSPVSITADQTTFDIMEDGVITTVFTIESADSRFKKMDIFLEVNWPSAETAWDTSLTDSNYDSLSNNQITLTKEGSATVILIVTCGSNCDAGDTNTVEVTGRTDPKFYNSTYEDDPSNHTNQCGSSDCLTETTPASSSSNTTNTVTITLNAWTLYSFDVNCDVNNTVGDSVVFSDTNILSSWNYSVENLGWSNDTYNITLTIYDEFGPNNGQYSDVTTTYFSVIRPNSATNISLSGMSPLVSGSRLYLETLDFFAINTTSGNYTYTLVVVSEFIEGAGKECVVNFTVENVETENTETEWEDTGYICTYSNETFCNEIRPYCADGVTKADGETCASMVDAYCADPGVNDTGCDSENADNSLADCYDITGKSKNDEFAQGYCGFFTDNSSEGKTLISTTTIIAIISALILIISYFLFKKESKH